MSLFKSTKEKRLWLFALAVVLIIISTLFLGTPLTELLADQNVRAVFFLMGMALVAGAVLFHGFRNNASRIEWVVLIGMLAIFLMLFLRLGMAERSHLIEFGVLAIFIYMAMSERMGSNIPILKPAIWAFGLSLLIGIIDEGLQIFIPDRVFDPVDIFFNGMAAFMAIGSSLLLQWLRKKFRKK